VNSATRTSLDDHLNDERVAHSTAERTGQELRGHAAYPGHAPYDRICVTAACPDVPPPLIEQLSTPGRPIAPVVEGRRQRLTLLEKTIDGVQRTRLANVLYVSLRGRYGVGGDPHR
jgi:protein-L-isoaspartate O-methyltransferase